MKNISILKIPFLKESIILMEQIGTVRETSSKIQTGKRKKVFFALSCTVNAMPIMQWNVSCNACESKIDNWREKIILLGPLT